jgi:phosphoribosylamine--glycine ligase
MKIAVIGSGGREHAIAWKFAQTEGWENVFTLPGNGGIPNSIAIDPMDFQAIEKFCLEKEVQLIFVGPEQPLSEGIVDYFRKTNIIVFGPTKEAAILESSKIFAKKFMKRHGVATAPFEIFSDINEMEDYGLSMDGNCVLKYDGLAAGKGVYVCTNKAELQEALVEIRETYANQGSWLVEKRIVGDEISMIGFTDGNTIQLLQPSQDHKQLLENDKGPNTGGMGAYSPVENLDPVIFKKIMLQVIKPTLHGMQLDKMDFKGMIYFGVMVEKGIPYLLEYNARFGDPETEVLLPALKNSLTEIVLSCFDGTLQDKMLKFHTGYFADVVLTSKGYPKNYPKGLNIKGLNKLPDDILVFHAGTKKENNEIVTSGGRVLNIIAQGESLEKALAKVYQAIDKIHFDGKYYRKDIGKRINAELKMLN